MLVALCQANPVVGDFIYNSDIVLKYYGDAVRNGAELVIFPEMVITGYPPQDLLTENRFIARTEEAAANVINRIGKIPAIFGSVRRENNRIYNSAVVAREGQMIAVYDKVLLPTYDVFDEHRYFTPGESFEPVTVPLKNGELRVGLQICEDLWDGEYECKVTDKMVNNGAEMIINISASPFSEGKRFERMNLIKKKSGSLGVPFVYCNQVGAQDELIFDGHSLVYDSDGRLIGEGAQFKEEVIMIDLDNSVAIDASPYDRERELFDGLILGIRDYFRKTGHAHCVIALSGGIDSALTACLAKEALEGQNVTCITMPSHFSSGNSVDDSVQLAENLGIELLNISIEELMGDYDSVLTSHFDGMARDITEENIQARIRGNIIMAFSNKLGYLVLSTGNKTELALGYCTLYGDMSGGLAAISDLSKTDVYALAEWYNRSRGEEIIPQNILLKEPSAELAEGQVDPFDYNVVSPLVDEIVENKRNSKELVKMGYDPALVERISSLVRRAEFKRRQAAPGLRVTGKAFGMGRRYPIVNYFDND